MPALVDSSAEVSISKLPPQIPAVANQHIQAFAAGTLGPDSDWNQVQIAPVARYVHDAAYRQGAAPAYVELRIVSSTAPADARGYIFISLTNEDFPVPEFGTGGETKTDKVAQAAGGGTIVKFMRFAPGYIAAEDGNGQPLGTLGTAPMKAAAAGATPAANYADLKSDYATNPLRVQRRALRVNRTAAVWRVLNGAKNPTLQLQIGQTQTFLGDKRLANVGVVASGPVEMARLLVLPAGGFRATGVSAGTVTLEVAEQNGTIDFFTLAVTAVVVPGAVALRDAKSDFTFWLAGTDWSGDQRQYDQLKQDDWCPLDGCGPTALAMLFGWWDANGVPSAFYRLDNGRGNAHKFRFNYESLRDSDAPKSTSNADQAANFVVPVYDDLYKLSNTMCFTTTDQGATAPDQMVSAFQEYVARITNSQPSPENEFGSGFVEMTGFEHGHVTAPGFGSTDWENGGKKVAHGIQAGYPGVVGIGSVLWDLHYPLAYGYKLIHYHDGSPDGHYFKCNMGWGPWKSPEFHNAEDVWFGLTAHFAQKAFPGSPDDVVAATFTAPLRAGVFTRDSGFKFQWTAAGDATKPDWAPQWSELPAVNVTITIPGGISVPARAFYSGPAACVSGSGSIVHVFGRAVDNRFWRAHSTDGGNNWDVAWDAVGPGTFNSAPAAAVSANGQNLHVFGRGLDNKIWRAHSPDGGNNWDVAWAAIEPGVFNSCPAAVISADGQSLHVFGRGLDNRIWRAHSPDGGNNWDVAWAPVADGVFLSSPGAAMSSDGKAIHLFGMGMDHQVWRALSLDGGASWPIAWAPIGGSTAY
ncbi:MAG: hypothetical protein ABI165_11095 [Bryobacteraceae bacterium]